MKLRESAIRLLLLAYPAAWRREFGAELEELLQHSKFGVPVIVNVIASGLDERAVDLLRRITKRGGMADRTFGAHYDRTARIVSVVAVVVLVALPLVAIGEGAILAVMGLTSLVVLALAYAYSPRGFEISGGEFHVKRLVGDAVFPLADLRFVRDATPADFRGCARLWGSGGLFGYYGLFWTKALGKSRWYVTDRSKALVVTDGSRNVLVSPEDREGFIAAVERADAQTLALGAESAGSGLILPLTVALGLASVGAALVLVAISLSYAPGRPPVDLTRDSLVIHSRYYGMTVPASSVDAANVRVVDLRTDSGWRPVWRTNGFANSHYRAGNFKTANGLTVKLFTTGSPRLVLLPPSREGGTPVLLDVAEPDQFVARVRRQWSGQ